MAGRGKGSLTTRDGPGPGAYRNNTIFEKIVGSSTFGKQPGLTDGKDIDPLSRTLKMVPGPGAYQKNHSLVTRNTGTNVFGSASRDKNTFYDLGTSGNPGPGTYSNQNIVGKEGQSVIMSPRRPDTTPTMCKDTPGPGTYNQDKFYMTMRSPAFVRIGKS
jgi:hypothetical protein